MACHLGGAAFSLSVTFSCRSNLTLTGVNWSPTASFSALVVDVIIMAVMFQNKNIEFGIYEPILGKVQNSAKKVANLKLHKVLGGV
jgi:hypothetical protein